MPDNPPPTEAIYKIGEIAERLGTTTRTLRFYEEQGLVEPSRSAKGTRRYSADDLARFEAVLRLAALNIPLKDIRALADARPGCATGDEASRRVAGLLNALEREIEEKLRLYRSLQQDVGRARDLVVQCFGCRRPPTRRDCATCPVARHLDSSRLLALIWDPEPASWPEN